MRIFIAFEDVRLPLDVQSGQTVGDVKQVLRDHFKVGFISLYRSLLKENVSKVKIFIMTCYKFATKL